MMMASTPRNFAAHPTKRTSRWFLNIEAFMKQGMYKKYPKTTNRKDHPSHRTNRKPNRNKHSR